MNECVTTETFELSNLWLDEGECKYDECGYVVCVATRNGERHEAAELFLPLVERSLEPGLVVSACCEYVRWLIGAHKPKDAWLLLVSTVCRAWQDSQDTELSALACVMREISCDYVT